MDGMITWLLLCAYFGGWLLTTRIVNARLSDQLAEKNGHPGTPDLEDEFSARMISALAGGAWPLLALVYLATLRTKRHERGK